MTRTQWTLLAAGTLLLAGQTSVAPQRKQVSDHLRSSDASARREAISTITSLLETNRDPTLESLRAQWMSDLYESKEYDAVARFGLDAVRLVPQWNDMCSQMLAFRARALARLSRHAEAKAAAKAAYNLAVPSGVANAIAVVSEVLAADPNAAGKDVFRFRFEQIDRLSPQAKDSDQSRTVLASIVIDASLYDAAIANRDGDWYGATLERGNLYLMSGRTTDALRELDLALTLAPPQYRQAARNAYAAAIRAHDGGVGRANQWLLEPQTAPGPAK